MDKIYLIHQTEMNNMNDIIEQKKLLPASKTKNKSQNPYDVHLPFIFMNCCKYKDFKYFYNINFTFIFDCDILHNRTFYTNETHSAGNIDTSVYYKKGISIKNINDILTKLYEKSKTKHKRVFYAFQEIFFKKLLSLEDAKYLIIPKNTDINLIDKIKKRLPNLILILQ